ncbi:hypothetical protein EVAR_53910_1 [Eumeta japonica]|uniref:Uncharacterized protein n=1 Tax=Eumeta variegata TaxID=151549 RepID=A0A4C1YIB7_EUMVA|nr:hypothetical protein EVAR_53910_1 [Eumeta japonica]
MLIGHGDAHRGPSPAPFRVEGSFGGSAKNKIDVQIIRPPRWRTYGLTLREQVTYKRLMKALEARCGDGYLEHAYCIQLKDRGQCYSKSLQ